MGTMQWAVQRTVGSPSLPAGSLSRLLYTARPPTGPVGLNRAALCQLSAPKPLLRGGCTGLLGLLRSAFSAGAALDAAVSLADFCADGCANADPPLDVRLGLEACCWLGCTGGGGPGTRPSAASVALRALSLSSGLRSNGGESIPLERTEPASLSLSSCTANDRTPRIPCCCDASFWDMLPSQGGPPGTPGLLIMALAACFPHQQFSKASAVLKGSHQSPA